MNNASKRGSALALSLILAAAIGVIAASILRFYLTELKLYTSHSVRLDARNAAESLVEYSIAELVKRVDSEYQMTSASLASNPIEITDDLKTELFADSNIVFDSLEVKASYLDEDGEYIYISEDDPTYDGDLLAGQLVWVKTVQVSAKATASTANNSSTAYVTNEFLIRDSPLLNYAIFYNMDAEFYPDKKMTVYDDVHINGDMYTGPNAKLLFEGNTTVSGDYFVQKKVNDTAIGNGTTYFNDVASRNGTTLYDSNYDTGDSDYDWDTFSEAYYGKDSLKTQTDSLTPVGTSEYVADDPSTAEIEYDNSSYSIIEPILPKTIDGETNEDYKGEDVRENKLAYEAGLILRVEYNTSYDPSTQPANEQYVVKAYKYDRVDSTDPSSAPIEEDDGSLKLLSVDLNIPIVGDVNADFDGLDDTDQAYPEGYSVTDGLVTGGTYDVRQKTGMDVFTLDMAALATAINNGDDTAFGNYSIANDWNGVVYFEFPTSTEIESSGEFAKGTSDGRSDNIVKAVSLTSDSTDDSAFDMALQVINAETLPKSSVAGEEGFTLATNGPLYTVGNYNADGDLTGDPSTEADDDEVPAALVSDTYTALSENWKDGRAYSNIGSYQVARSAVSTEVSAALITGTTPTRIESYDSNGDPIYESGVGGGGVQNFIRKQESWENMTLAYRGSMVSLFHSEAHPNRVTSFYNRAPTRTWGYHEFFKDGNFPPGLPMARDYSRSRFRMITQSEYESL
jgi:hypothetical protein